MATTTKEVCISLPAHADSGRESYRQSFNTRSRIPTTKLEQINKKKIRFRPSYLTLEDGLQEENVFGSSHAVECYEDDARYVLLIARCRGRTVALRVRSPPTVTEIGLDALQITDCNVCFLLHGRFFAEFCTLELASTLPGGVSDAPAVTGSIQPVPVQSRNLAELLHQCSVQAHRIHSIAQVGNTFAQNYRQRERPRERCGAAEPEEFLAGSDIAIEPLTEYGEDEQAARHLFTELGAPAGSDGVLPIDAVWEAAQRRTAVRERTFLESLYAKLRAGRPDADHDARVPFGDFLSAYVAIPRVRGDLVRWAASLGLDTALARLLRPGDTFDGLRGLRVLSAEEAEAHVLEVSMRLAAALPGLLRAGLERLRASTEKAKAITEHFNAKFVSEGLTMGKFASLEDFYKGPEALIGMPNPRVFEGMETEHCNRPNASHTFTSPNYNVETFPKQEWEVVVSPVVGKQYPHTPLDKSAWPEGNTWYGECGRDVVGVEELMMREDVRAKVERAGLLKDEVISLRLYSGPMFLLYNAAMRGEPLRDVIHLQGNKYETTIFVIASGITKLSKATAMPVGRLLYRGLGGDLQLPDHFLGCLSECRVTLTVHTTGLNIVRIVQQALMDNIVPKQSEMSSALRSRLVLQTPAKECTELADGGSTQHLVEVGLMTAPRVVDGKNVRLEVALPASKCGRKKALALFINAVQACCVASLGGQDSDLKVTIDEELETPGDFRGGVELGMLSLTASKETAMRYGKSVSGRCGTVFEVQVGRVDVGASIGFLSQYPREREYLMPPLSCLEVIGEPRLDRIGDSTEVMIVPLRVNVNLKSATVEEMVARRKLLHAATAKNLKEELVRHVKEQIERLELVFQKHNLGKVEFLRGLQQHVKITDAPESGCEVHFPGCRWASVGAPYLSLASGLIFFEVEIIEAKGQLAVGFAGTRYRSDVKGEIGDDNISWGVYSFDKNRHSDHADPLPEHCMGWFSPGSVLGLAVDLQTGQMLVKVNQIIQDEFETGAGPEECGWMKVFDSGVSPCETAGGGLFPVLAGGWGARVKYNFGHTEMFHAPPTAEYMTVAKAAMVQAHTRGYAAFPAGGSQNDTENLTTKADELLEELNVGRNALLQDFQKVHELHLMRKPEEFNNDEVYKDILNEIIDTKSCLERKQSAVVELLQAGATFGQLSVVSAAPAKDFHVSNSVEVECPGYSWRLILSGWVCFLKEVLIPLDCAPCLIAVLWRELLEGGGNPSVILGAGEYGRKVKVADLVPALQLETVGLFSRRYEHAVLALVLASTSKSACSSKGGSLEMMGFQTASADLTAVAKPWALTSADFRGMDFAKDRIMDLARAVFAGRLHGPLRKVNGLVVVQPVEGEFALQNLRYCVLRDMYPISQADVSHATFPQQGMADAACEELGSLLDPVDWSFVAAEAACGGWKALDLSKNSLGPSGSTGLSIGLGAVITLTLLDLSSNKLMPAGATAVSSALAELTALVRLELGFNSLGPAGGSAVAQSLSRLTELQTLGLSNNVMGPDGVTIVCKALSALSVLTSLDVSVNCLNETGGEAVLKMLQKLQRLKVIKLGGQDLGGSVFPILEVLVPRIISLSVAFGSVTAIPEPCLASSDIEGAFNMLSRPPPLDIGSHYAFHSQQQVNTIDLKDRQMLGAEGAGQLAAVLRAGLAFCSLTALELAHNCLRLEGAKALGSVLFQLSALTRLDLSHNKFECLGANCFVGEINKLSELMNLSLEGNYFGTAGWVSLSDSLDWMPRLKSLNGHAEYHTIRSGTVQILDLSHKELAAAIYRLLPRCSNSLTYLDASHSCLNSGINDTPDSKAVSQVIASFSTLSALTGLSVSDNGLGTVGGHALGVALTSLVLLTALDVSRVELREDGATALAAGLYQLTALVDLRLAGNRIGAYGFALLCNALPVPAKLQSLDIGDNFLSDEGASIMAKSICSLSKLKRLAAPGNHFGSVGGKFVGDLLSCMHGLTELDLASNKLEMKGCEAVLNALAEVARGPEPALLRTLNLSNNCLDGDVGSATAAFFSLEDLYSLETLILSKNRLGSKGGGAVLAALGTHTALRTLDLGYVDLGQPGGLAVGNCLMHLMNLASLFLEGNCLGQYGAAAIVKGLSDSSTLRTLDLRYNNLQKAGGLAIGKGLSRIVSLEALDLDGNELGPEGGRAVARGVENLIHLVSLDLRDNALGSHGCHLVAECFTNFKDLNLDLRWNELERRGRGKEPASVFSRLVKGTQSRERQLISVKYPGMTIRGWLRKLNAVKEGEMENAKNWRDRLCFVRDNKMFYKSAKKKGQPEEVAELTKITSVCAAADGWPHGHFIFHVNIDHGRGMVFSASSAHERAQWIAALQIKPT